MQRAGAGLAQAWGGMQARGRHRGRGEQGQGQGAGTGVGSGREGGRGVRAARAKEQRRHRGRDEHGVRQRGGSEVRSKHRAGAGVGDRSKHRGRQQGECRVLGQAQLRGGDGAVFFFLWRLWGYMRNANSK